MSETPTAGSEADELRPHREQIERFLRLREEDPFGALAFAQRAVAEAPSRRHHPRRGDALELLALAQTKIGNFRQALDCTTELVRIRRRAKPVNYELLALALGQQALALFAMEQSDEADAVLEEQLATWRKAYSQDDIRLALKLENYAEHVAKGFGRSDTVAKLLREAIAIREAFPEPARGALAATLQELALHELLSCSYKAAAQHLTRAAELLLSEIQRDPEDEEKKAGLVQIQLLRAGIAGAAGDLEQAISHAEVAKGVRFRARAAAVESEILLAGTIGVVLKLNGDLAGAIEQHERKLAILNRNDDLLGTPGLDDGLLGDVYLSLASLHLENGDPGEAREYLAGAIVQLGRTSAVLLALAEFRRQMGKPELALQHYQRALRLRKESSTEMLVLFGTNRKVEQPSALVIFGKGPAAESSLGFAVIRVPGAQFSTTSWLAPLPTAAVVGRATNPEPLVFRPDTPVIDATEFRVRSRTAAAAARLYPESALVFVHGYNVSFEDALKRGAQLVRDLNYDSAAFVFSWPSLGLRSAYHIDRRRAHDSAAPFADFLEEVEQASGATKVHIIAHSMGNRVALGGLAAAMGRKSSRLREIIGELVLAAPAVPVPEFIERLDELQGHGLQRVTLYASADDRALQVGFLAEGFTALAGYVDNGLPVQHPILQSIDITASGGINFLDHDVFASNPVMMEDIRQLLQTGIRPPHKRAAHFVARPSESVARYWQYMP